MSDQPGNKIKAGTLPPDLADHPDYQIVRELGRGGMGVVSLTHNRLMGRDEVLKVVGRHLIDRKGVLERFSREIRSAALDASQHRPRLFRLSFRRKRRIRHGDVDGLDLAKLVKIKGPGPVAHASYFVHQAALGLQHAHEQGMVHCAIKPGNLMLTHKKGKPIVKVLEFGLDKATRESQLEGASTHEGQMLGTPDFIAPEQIRDPEILRSANRYRDWKRRRKQDLGFRVIRSQSADSQSVPSTEHRQAGLYPASVPCPGEYRRWAMEPISGRFFAPIRRA